jgi:putative hydrolase of HD superfamily
MTDALAVLLETMRLKAVARAGWVRVGVHAPESVAAHTWGVSWLVLLLLPDDLDREKALAYAVVHDLAEAWVGDVTPHDGVSPTEKAYREHRAIAALARRMPRGPELLRTWEAYEAQADPEARFVRELDRLDMALQALVYAGDGARTAEFVASAERVVAHPALVPLLAAIRAEIGR